MAIKFEISAKLNLGVTRAVGRVDDLDLLQYQQAIPNTVNFKPTLNTLFDARSISENLISPESIIRFSSSTPFESSVKRAYVVSDDKVGMLATVFGSTTSDDRKFLVTYNMSSACEWLDVELEDVMALNIFKDTT